VLDSIGSAHATTIQGVRVIGISSHEQGGVDSPLN
jgi:hypothetical protein